MSAANFMTLCPPAIPVVDAGTVVAGAAAALGAAITLTPQQSGGYFVLSKAAAYTVTIPAPSAANVGLRYTFVSGAVQANTVAVTCGAAANIGTIITANSVGSAAGTNINFANPSVLGDSAEATYVSPTQIAWRCFSGVNGGIAAT
jgi:hypothetical protein